METALFFDTETSGLPLFREPSEDPRQPHIVQLGALLVDMASRRVLSAVDLIIRPDGWEIPDEVAAIHGITTEQATRAGIDESLALDLLIDLQRRASVRIAHNTQFDDRIVRIAIKRFFGDDEAEKWAAGASDCTAKLAGPIMQLPPTEKMVRAGFKHHKTPNLREAHLHFLGRPLEGAHSAMADARGCMDVFFAIQDLQAKAAA